MLFLELLLMEISSKALNEAEAGHVFQEFKDINALPEDSGRRVITTGGHFGYLKIAEGCDKHCTYCIIPSLRGKFRSVPEERLLKQAEYMASQGVRELILVAQETTVYGTDLYGKKLCISFLRSFARLKESVGSVFFTVIREEIYDELIQVMKEEKKICHYLDLPIQHASDRILKRMGRRTSKSTTCRNHYQAAQRDPGYRSQDIPYHRLSGRNRRRPSGTDGICR